MGKKRKNLTTDDLQNLVIRYPKAIIIFLITIIRVYQLFISPLIGNNCRFTPTCSEYAIQSIKLNGPIKGIFVFCKRISKCHPWGGTGYDPVPDQKQCCSKLKDWDVKNRYAYTHNA